jgi:hypothetical protein
LSIILLIGKLPARCQPMATQSLQTEEASANGFVRRFWESGVPGPSFRSRSSQRSCLTHETVRGSVGIRSKSVHDLCDTDDGLSRKGEPMTQSAGALWAGRREPLGALETYLDSTYAYRKSPAPPGFSQAGTSHNTLPSQAVRHGSRLGRIAVSGLCR